MYASLPAVTGAASRGCWGETCAWGGRICRSWLSAARPLSRRRCFAPEPPSRSWPPWGRGSHKRVVNAGLDELSYHILMVWTLELIILGDKNNFVEHFVAWHFLSSKTGITVPFGQRSVQLTFLYTVKNISNFPIPSRDVTKQTLSGLE